MMISVVIPTFNAEKYIAESIESILYQTHENWELIVVDDCSTDKTVEIVAQYCEKYSRIRLIERKTNSGGARTPRYDGILVATGDLVTHIDADDFIEKNYLQKMLARKKATNAILVLSKLKYCTEQGKLDSRQIPIQRFDISQIMSGREACRITIGGWQINMAGLLVETIYYQSFIKTIYQDDCNSCFNDELDYRKLLLSVPTVAIADTIYFYRQQPASVVHRTSSQYFDRLNQLKPLYQFISANFKNEPDILHKIQAEYINNVYLAECAYRNGNKKYPAQERAMITEKIRDAYGFLHEQKIKGNTLKQRWIMVSYWMMTIITRLRKTYIMLSNK